jgi:hypothetical protein
MSRTAPDGDDEDRREDQRLHVAVGRRRNKYRKRMPGSGPSPISVRPSAENTRNRVHRVGADDGDAGLAM